MIRIVERGCCDQLGEGPLWSERHEAVYWTDIFGKKLNRLSLSTGSVHSWLMPGHIGWVIERRAGGLVAGIDRSVVALDANGAIIETIARLASDQDGNRLNDAKADPLGRIWAGTMPLESDEPCGALHRIESDGSVACVDNGYRIANGPAIGEDGRILLHTDSAIRTIYSFAINDDGSLGPRSLFVQFEPDWGIPDGMTFDEEGGLWVACWGGGQIIRFSPDGRRDRAISMPASQITSCTFAGKDLDRMFVTSAAVGLDEPMGGALFEVDPGCRGLPACQFAG